MKQARNRATVPNHLRGDHVGPVMAFGDCLLVILLQGVPVPALRGWSGLVAVKRGRHAAHHKNTVPPTLHRGLPPRGRLADWKPTYWTGDRQK
jgi:hypothetical protein